MVSNISYPLIRDNVVLENNRGDNYADCSDPSITLH